MGIIAKSYQHAVRLEFRLLMYHGIEWVRCRWCLFKVRWWTQVARLRLWWNGAKAGAGLRVDGPIHILVHPNGTLEIGKNVRILSSHSANISGAYMPSNFIVDAGASLFIGSNVRIQGSTHIKVNPDGKVKIGDNVRIQCGLLENAVGWYMPGTFVVGTGANLTIGANAALSNCAIVCDCSIIIGCGAFIGGGARIYDSDFHSLVAAERLAGSEGIKLKPIVLDDNTFVGGHTIILKGSIMGSGSVLGGGAVLAGKVPAGEIWAGNPARKLGDVPIS